MRPLLALLLLSACPSAEGELPPDGPVVEDEQASLGEAFEADLVDVLQQQFDTHSPPGLAIAVRPHDAGAWAAAVGLSSPDSDRALDRSDRFRIGSATETFVMAAVTRHQSDDFRLDRVPDQQLDGLPNSWGVTALQMFDHTAGVPDYRDHASFDASAAWTLDELLALADELPVQHNPGEFRTWTPTNTAYMARALEALGGRSWDAEVRAVLLDPLGLDNVDLPTDAWGPIVGSDSPAGDHPSAWVGSANMTASPANLAEWTWELFSGDVLSAQQVFDLTATPYHQGGSGFGPGVELVDEDSPQEQWVSRGTGSGHTAWMGYRQDLDTAVVVMANTDAGAWAESAAAAVWSVVAEHVSPPTGDDDDVTEPPETPTGQLTLHGLQVHDPAGSSADPAHTGVTIGGWWDFDNDGQTVGRITLTSADFSSGSPVGAVQCSFDAHGNYSPEWGQHGTSGALFIDQWGTTNCNEWSSAGSWQSRIAGNLQGLHLMAWDDVPDSWTPTWSGWSGGSIRDHVQGWMATEGQNRGASQVPWVVLGTIDGVTVGEPDVTPWTFLGFFWR